MMNAGAVVIGALAATLAGVAVSHGQSLTVGDLVVGSRQFGSLYTLPSTTGLFNGLVTGPDMQVSTLPVRGAGPVLPTANGHLALLCLPGGRLVARPSSNTAWGVYEIAPATGDRTLIPGTNGPAWATGGDMVALDDASLLAIVDDFVAAGESNGRIVRLDLTTGNWTTISGGTVGNGVVMHRPRSLARVDLNTVAVVEFGPVTGSLPGLLVYLVDVPTGNRTVLSTLGSVTASRYTVTGGVRSATRAAVPARGTGPVFDGQARGLTALNGRLFAATALGTPFAGAVVEIDLATGNRSLVVGTGLVGGQRVVAEPGPGSSATMPESPTGLQPLSPVSLVFSSTFGPNRLWDLDLSTRRLKPVANFDPQILPEFQSVMRFSGLTVVPPAWCRADVTGVGGPPALPDGLITGDDFNAFIAAFAGTESLADVVGIGGLPPGDGLVTGDDFNAFIAAFAGGCP